MRRSLFLLMFFALCLPAPFALAQAALRTEGDVSSAAGPYEAEVPVASQSDADRSGALARALGSVFAKISGDRGATARPGVMQVLRNASDYVQSYDYRQDQGTSASGAPSYRTVLVARFRQDDVDAIASALGLPVWPQPRPKPVIWLAIDDGSGPRLVTVQQSNAARPLLDKAVERGYRLGLPTGSAAEQALVGAIWRQDTAAIARASARYAPPMQLIGKLYRSGSNWKADWVFVDNGKELARWSTTEGDARRAMAGGADGAADALVKRYARAGGGSGAAGTYRVVVTNLHSAEDYLRVAAALRGAPVVRSMVPVRAQQDRIELLLEMTTGPAGLNRMLGQESDLVPASPVDPDALTLPGETVPAAPTITEYRLR